VVCLAPRARDDGVRPRRLSGVVARPLDFTVRAHMKRDVDEHDELYARAFELLGFTTTIVPPVRLSWFQRGRIRQGIPLLERVIRLNPQNWAALWVVGKAYQAAKQNERALEALSRAHLVKPDNPDIAREASISAMECSKHEVAIRFAEKASSLDKADPGLRANLALVYLFSEKPAIAKLHIEDAYARDPTDPVTGAVRRVIDEVIAGKRSCPHHRQDV
jgi:tetratricopeptide (TPR) repeat protein